MSKYIIHIDDSTLQAALRQLDDVDGYEVDDTANVEHVELHEVEQA